MAQVVVRLSIGGTKQERPLERFLGLVGMALGIQDLGKVVVRIRQGRIERNGFFVGNAGGFEATLQFVDVAQVGPCRSQFGVCGHRRLKLGAGLVQAARHGVTDPQSHTSHPVLGVLSQHFLKALLRCSNDGRIAAGDVAQPLQNGPGL